MIARESECETDILTQIAKLGSASSQNPNNSLIALINSVSSNPHLVVFASHQNKDPNRSLSPSSTAMGSVKPTQLASDQTAMTVTRVPLHSP